MIRALLIVLLLAPQAYAQVRLAATVTPETATVGDRITYTVSVKKSDIANPQFPQKLDKPEPFEQIDARVTQDETSHRIVFTLVAFQTGRHQLPPYAIEWLDAQGRKQMVATEPLFVDIKSVLPTDEKERTLKDIAGEAEAKLDWKQYLLPAMILLTLLLAVAALIYYLRKRKRQPPVAPPAVVVSPYEAAISSFEAIRREDRYAKGEVKEYYSDIADTARRYLEERFGMDALEKTTHELSAAWPSLLTERKTEVMEFLGLCDAVKFAKAFPAISDAHDCLERAEQFVRSAEETHRRQSQPVAAND